MRKILAFALLVLLIMVAKNSFAQSSETDLIDVELYTIEINYDFPENQYIFEANTSVFFNTRDPQSDTIILDLICDEVLDVVSEYGDTLGFRYDRSNVSLHIALPQTRFGVKIHYGTNGYVEGYGWGGLHISRDMCYNLGVAFDEYPHNYGRAWFPCRDNFYDKANYFIRVHSPNRYQHQCSGVCLSATENDGIRTTEWELSNPAPTYLVSVALAPFHTIERPVNSLYGNYPLTLAFTSHDSTRVAEAYEILDDVVPMFERCLGPYRWDRIGYVATEKGSMEHINNIGLVSVCMADKEQMACQMTICHELAHAWFGNLITCASQEDMWFNEGGASFCEELANEAAYGKESSVNYYQEMLSKVLRTAHMDDGGYRSLSGMDRHYTYGTTSYKQGAMMWHSLRGYLGDSLFYQTMRQFFAQSGLNFPSLSAEQIRDSLSAISNVDLTDFFNFHVFNPGFVDYSVDAFEVAGNNASITLRQLLRAAPSYSRGNRVPVTFFSQDRREETRLMEFDDSVATETFSLPFAPAYAVVDYYHALSDACTSDTVALATKGLKDLNNAYAKIYVNHATSGTDAWVHVGHHYVRPEGELPEGMLRISDRYWQVAGIVPWDGDVQGRFFYNQGTNNTAGAAFLDYGFYDKRQTLDSMCLVYRPTAHDVWQVVSRTRTSSSSATKGYFTARLFPGQYALAVIDSNIVSIPEIEQPQSLSIRPNPAHSSQFGLYWTSATQPLDITIFDATGKEVFRQANVTNATKIRHHLTAGIYVVVAQFGNKVARAKLVIE